VTTLAEALEPFRSWTEPRLVNGEDGALACWVDTKPAADFEIDVVIAAGLAIPEALELWSQCRTASLCEETETQSWGLHLLSPPEARELTAQELANRPEDYHTDELIIGEFYGDLEYLVLAPSEQAGRQVVISLPMEHRAAWRRVAGSLTEFLIRYYEAEGAKWWEE
jgi:hypothetical protein